VKIQIMNLESFISHIDDRGTLSVAQCGELRDNFEIRRVFWITDIPIGAVRGEHANRECTELLVAVHGSVTLWLTDGENEWSVTLDNKAKGVYIAPMVWCKLFDFSEGTTLLCMADKPYNSEQYINDFDDFLSEVRNTKVANNNSASK